MGYVSQRTTSLTFNSFHRHKERESNANRLRKQQINDSHITDGLAEAVEVVVYQT